MVIPRSLREEAGVAEGTLLKVSVLQDGQFLLTPQVTIDRAIAADARKNRKQLFRELAQTVAQLRKEAKANGLARMSSREIDAAVTAARRDLAKPSRRKTG